MHARPPVTLLTRPPQVVARDFKQASPDRLQGSGGKGGVLTRIRI